MSHMTCFKRVQLTVTWFENGLKALPNQTPGGTVRATNQQLSEFHSAISRYYFWRCLCVGLSVQKINNY